MGTRMLGEALALEARVALLPENQPSRRLLLAARSSPWRTWARDAEELRLRMGDLPDVLTWMPTRRREGSVSSPDERRALASEFRHFVILPALDKHDASVLQIPAALPRSWLWLADASWGGRSWEQLKIWSVVRSTRRFPLPLLDLDGLPQTLPTCPFCPGTHKY